MVSLVPPHPCTDHYAPKSSISLFGLDWTDQRWRLLLLPGRMFERSVDLHLGSALVLCEICIRPSHCCLDPPRVYLADNDLILFVRRVDSVRTRCTYSQHPRHVHRHSAKRNLACCIHLMKVQIISCATPVKHLCGSSERCLTRRDIANDWRYRLYLFRLCCRASQQARVEQGGRK